MLTRVSHNDGYDLYGSLVTGPDIIYHPFNQNIYLGAMTGFNWMYFAQYDSSGNNIARYQRGFMDHYPIMFQMVPVPNADRIITVGIDYYS